MDDSSGYEEILEKLTERNLDLVQKNRQLEDTLADLEASQEVGEVGGVGEIFE